MSVVTGIMLLLGASDWDEAPSEEVNEWLADRGWPPLRDVSEHVGGGKHPQFQAWGAGYNYFGTDEAAFINFVLSRDWREPGDVILIINPEEGPMCLHRPCDSDGSGEAGETVKQGSTRRATARASQEASPTPHTDHP